MNDEEKVLELIKNNGGLIKTSDVTSKNINKMALIRLVDKGFINRLERGLYIDANKIEDLYYVFQYKQEYKLIRDALLDFRNKQIRQGVSADFFNELMYKIMK